MKSKTWNISSNESCALTKKPQWKKAALRILNTPDPFEKARLGDAVASRWLDAAIPKPYYPSRDLHVPDRPALILSSVSAFFLSYLVFDEIPHRNRVSCRSWEKPAACREE